MNKINRVTHKDMAKSIVTTKAAVPGGYTDRNFGREPKRETLCFTMFGKHEYLNDDSNPVVEDENNTDVLAKVVVVNNGNPRYLIRRDSNGRFFNPLGIDEGKHLKFIHQAGKEQFEFRAVNKSVFDSYLSFLRTKNVAHLRTAEREGF